jgi:hypothetical protein
VRWVLVVAGVGLVVAGAALAVRETGDDRWSTYGGEHEGWTVDVPPGWDVQVFDDAPCEYLGYRSAVILTDADFEFHGPRPGEPEECKGRFILSGFPRDGVALAFQPYGIGMGLGRPDCLEAPIDHEDLLKVRLQGSGPVKARYHYVCSDSRRLGPAYLVKTWVGREAPARALAELERVLASFRFLRPPQEG